MSPLRAPGCRAPWMLVAALSAVLVGALPALPAAADDAWLPPVPGGVVRDYREPLAQFGAGHRGMDFAAPANAPVRATSDGRVTFAGEVSGSLHVVIEHNNGIRTSYSFLASVDVEEGQAVKRGTPVGTAGGHEGSHGAGVVHFGARVGSQYIDPKLLFGPTDLTQLVRLVPAEPYTASDAELILRELDDDGGCGIVQIVCDVVGAVGDAAGWTWDQIEDAVDLAMAALATVVEATKEFIAQVDQLVREVLHTLKDVVEGVVDAAERLAQMVADGVVDVFNAVVDAALKFYEDLTSCPQPPAKAHSEGSGNIAVAVGGMLSSRRRQAPDAHGDVYDESFDTRWRIYGYTRDEVTHFSYRTGSETYQPKDTLGDLHAQARSLGKQLKEAARANPGRAIDLVGHSQGGLVIDLFITEVYRGHEDEYPPIENVITFGSPHEGTPVADLAQNISDHLAGPFVEWIDPTDVIGAESVEQMTTESDTIKHLWDDGGVPPEIRYLSIVGSEDPIAPSHRADVPGGAKVVVPTGTPLLPDDHSAVLRDHDAVSAAQAHLEGRAPADSCGLLTDLGAFIYEELVVDKVIDKIAATPGGTNHPLNPEFYIP